MNELQLRIFSVLMFIAYRVVNPCDRKANAFLNQHRDWFNEFIGMHDLENLEGK